MTITTLDDLLRAAAELPGDLPAVYLTAQSHDGGRRSVTVHVDSFDALADWSLRLGEPIREPWEADGYRYHLVGQGRLTILWVHPTAVAA